MIHNKRNCQKPVTEFDFDSLPMPVIKLARLRLSVDDLAIAKSIVDSESQLLEQQPHVSVDHDGEPTLLSGSAACLWVCVARILSPRNVDVEVDWDRVLPANVRRKDPLLPFRILELGQDIVRSVPREQHYGWLRFTQGPLFNLWCALADDDQRPELCATLDRMACTSNGSNVPSA